MSLNRVILIGRLTRQPELRITPKGVSVCNVSIAVDRRNKNDGTDFFDIVAWGKTAEYLCKYQDKGNLIGVDGRLQTRSYETKDGQKRTVVEVWCDSIQFLSPRSGNNPEE